MLNGISITLITRTETGKDAFNRPVYETEEVTVENVLVGQPTPDERLETFNLTGRRVQYTLGIPKGDNHQWEGAEIILPPPFAGHYKVIGIPVAGIEANIPLSWNAKVEVERYG